MKKVLKATFAVAAIGCICGAVSGAAQQQTDLDCVTQSSDKYNYEKR